MNSKLKPCPFCGGEPDLFEAPSVYFVECSKCYYPTNYDTKEEAINAWNRRAYEPKSGTWKLESEFEGTKTWECPFCHEVYYFDDFTYKFCPACGAHLEMEMKS